MFSGKELNKNLVLITFCSVASFALFPKKIAVLLFAIWFVIQLISNKKELSKKVSKNLNWLLPTVSFFIICAVSLLFETPNKDTLHGLERKIALFAIPLGFYLIKYPLSKKVKELTIQSFIISTLLYAVFVTSQLLVLFYKNWHSLNLEGLNYAIRSQAEKIGGLHSTYYSLFALLSTFFILDLVYLRKNTFPKIYKIALITGAFFLFLTCLFLETRAPIIAFIFASFIVVYVKNKKKGLLFLSSTIVIIILLFSTIPSLGNRFKEAFNAELLDSQTVDYNSSNIRKTIHFCSVEIIKENWLTGVGPNNYTNEYLNCYSNFSNDELSLKKFNSHNQYFDSLIQYGIVGLLSLLVLLFFPMHKKLFYSDSRFLFFKLFFIVCFATENILSRQDGVLLFAFLNTFFIHNYFVTSQKDSSTIPDKC